MRDGDQHKLYIVREDQVQNHLRNPNIQNSTGPNLMHPRVLNELG